MPRGNVLARWRFQDEVSGATHEVGDLVVALASVSLSLGSLRFALRQGDGAGAGGQQHRLSPSLASGDRGPSPPALECCDTTRKTGLSEIFAAP